MREALATRYAAGVATRREKTEYGYSTTGYRVSAASYVDESGHGTFALANRVEFLADEHSLTSYAQTLRETHFAADGTLASTIDYSYGQDELTQTTRSVDAAGSVTSEETLVFGHDAHGSVRLLTTLAGAIEQLFLYDAYGADLAIFNAAASVFIASTQPRTTVRYNGEYFDKPTQQYYLRARPYDTQAGRFPTLDPYSGDVNNPLSFHKYGFVHGDPVQGVDPSGLSYELASTLVTASIRAGLTTMVSSAAVGALYGFVKHQTVEAAVRNALVAGAAGFVIGSGAGLLFESLSLAFVAFGAAASTATFASGTIVNSLFIAQASAAFSLAVRDGDPVDIAFATLGLGTASGLHAWRTATFATSLSAHSDMVNLASSARTAHILSGDRTGGGHMWPGKPNKSLFPRTWSGEKIMHIVSDIATDPNAQWTQKTGPIGKLFTKAGDPSRFEAVGTREGVTIRVIVEVAGEGIITAHPID